MLTEYQLQIYISNTKRGSYDLRNYMDASGFDLYTWNNLKTHQIYLEDIVAAKEKEKEY